MNKKKFKKVLIVFGGNSGERDVSLESGKACIDALKKKKYIVVVRDLEETPQDTENTGEEWRMLLLLFLYFW